MKAFFKNKTVKIFPEKQKALRDCPQQTSASLNSGQKLFKDVSLQEKEAFQGAEKMMPDKHWELHKGKNDQNEGKQEKLFNLFLSVLNLSVGIIGFCLLTEVWQSSLIFLL